jgi:hypothetical protein
MRNAQTPFGACTGIETNCRLSNESDAEWEVRRDKLLSDLKHIAQHMYRRMAAMLMTEDQIDFSAITKRRDRGAQTSEPRQKRWRDRD